MSDQLRQLVVANGKPGSHSANCLSGVQRAGHLRNRKDLIGRLAWFNLSALHEFTDESQMIDQCRSMLATQIVIASGWSASCGDDVSNTGVSGCTNNSQCVARGIILIEQEYTHLMGDMSGLQMLRSISFFRNIPGARKVLQGLIQLCARSSIFSTRLKSAATSTDCPEASY